MSVSRDLLAIGAIVMVVLGFGGAPASAASITGTATYRERMLLPPGAVFEATLEDVSHADAPSEVIGRARIDSPGSPPFRFAIDYDPSHVKDGRRYAVRARITLDRKLMFTSDTAYPVMEPGGATHVDMPLRRIGAGEAPAAAPAESARRKRGAYTYFADTGMFVDCVTGQRLPVAQEGDNAALEAAYAKVRTAPGALTLAVVEGRVEMRKPMEGAARPTLIVERLVEVVPGRGCEGLSNMATLENTYWKLVSLGGGPVEVAEKQSEPHIILQAEQRRVVGSGGCNRLTGSYTLEGERLAFGPMAGTMMMCPQGMAQERAFLDALALVARWRVVGERLELFDAGGASLAQFESRYMK